MTFMVFGNVVVIRRIACEAFVTLATIHVCCTAVRLPCVRSMLDATVLVPRYGRGTGMDTTSRRLRDPQTCQA